jgi:hypothetical protein
MPDVPPGTTHFFFIALREVPGVHPRAGLPENRRDLSAYRLGLIPNGL